VEAAASCEASARPGDTYAVLLETLRRQVQVAYSSVKLTWTNTSITQGAANSEVGRIDPNLRLADLGLLCCRAGRDA